MALEPRMVGNVGLFYACYHLSLLGWNVMPTTRNSRGIDVMIYSGDGKRFHGIQVKTLSKRTPVPLGKSIDAIVGDFMVIVTDATSANPGVFVLLPKEVKAKAEQIEKDGKVAYWLQPKVYAVEKFQHAWGRIGKG